MGVVTTETNEHCFYWFVVVVVVLHETNRLCCCDASCRLSLSQDINDNGPSFGGALHSTSIPGGSAIGECESLALAL